MLGGAVGVPAAPKALAAVREHSVVWFDREIYQRQDPDEAIMDPTASASVLQHISDFQARLDEEKHACPPLARLTARGALALVLWLAASAALVSGASCTRGPLRLVLIALCAAATAILGRPCRAPRLTAQPNGSLRGRASSLPRCPSTISAACTAQPSACTRTQTHQL